MILKKQNKISSYALNEFELKKTIFGEFLMTSYKQKEQYGKENGYF